MAHYAAMVSAMDESVGQILGALEEKGIEDETVVIFTSDQGGTFENPPYSGGKMINTLYEGGTRVPLMIKYGDNLPVTHIEKPVFTYDIFPTLVAFAGGDPKNMDDLEGSNVIPLIRGDDTNFKDRPVISYRSYENQYISVLKGQWKFIGYRDGKVELFDLSRDVTETNNVSELYPEKVDSMIMTIKVWEKEKGVFEFSGFK
jgi:arylsulfatase A-like enzyme